MSATQTVTQNFLISIVSDKTAEQIKAGLSEYLKSLEPAAAPDKVEAVKPVYGLEFASIDDVSKTIKAINEFAVDLNEEENPADLLFQLYTVNDKPFEDGRHYVRAFLQSLVAFFLIPEYSAAYAAMPCVNKENLFHYLPALHTMFENLEQSQKVEMLLNKSMFEFDPYHQKPEDLKSINDRINRYVDLEAFRKQQWKKAS